MAFSETKHIHLPFYGSSQLQNTQEKLHLPQPSLVSNAILLTHHRKKLLNKKLLHIQVDITNPLIHSTVNVKSNLSDYQDLSELSSFR